MAVRKWILRVLFAAGAGYLMLLGVVYARMQSSPATFNAFMAGVPMPVMMGLPFQTLWFRAREGRIVVGQQAPDFALRRLHQEGEVRLSEHRGVRPVLLVFGSYT